MKKSKEMMNFLNSIKPISHIALDWALCSLLLKMLNTCDAHANVSATDYLIKMLLIRKTGIHSKLNPWKTLEWKIYFGTLLIIEISLFNRPLKYFTNTWQPLLIDN